jgi:hypothetical protein
MAFRFDREFAKGPLIQLNMAEAFQYAISQPGQPGLSLQLQ